MDPRQLTIGAVTTVLLMTGCTTPTAPVNSMTATAAPQDPASAPTSSDPTSEQGVSLVALGFGQAEKYVAPIAIVKNNTQDVGQFVTVNFNLLDKSGTVIASTDQIEQITWPGQELLLPGWEELDSAKTKVAKVEATISVSDPDNSQQALAQYTTGPVKVTEDEFGGYQGSFDVLNPSAEKLTDLRIGVACYNKAGDIIGGTSVYPELVPANGKIKAETSSLTVSGKPNSCKAFPGGFSF